MASDPKIQKTIRRCQQRVQEGQFYEAHQQLRVIAARYVKQKDFVSATEVLHGGAGELLRGGQGGSAGDLCFYLVTILRDGQIRIDDNLRTKLIGLLNLFSSEEPSLKKYTDELLKWSSQFSDSPCGDPEVQLAVGRSLVDSNPYAAEKHLIVSGLPDAVPPLVDLLYAWYTSTSQPHAAPLFLSRAILPYLVLGNLRDASRSYTLFLSKLLSENSASAPQSISSNSDDLKILPSLPGINFLGLLCLAVKRADAGSFRQLRSHYATCIEEAGCWSDPLEELGESCFGIPIPRRGNPLMDIMSNLMGGGGARAALGGGGGSNRGTQNRISYAQTPMDVD